MPGVILYRECKARLDYLKREHSDLFSKHSLYVEVMKILEIYNFKLTARRDILSLFSESARSKPTVAAAAALSVPTTPFNESTPNGNHNKEDILSTPISLLSEKQKSLEQ
jgi:hypothetical protein